MFFDARSQLKFAEIFPVHRYHKDGAVIIRELLKKGSILDDTYYGLVGVDTGDRLLETNVFVERHGYPIEITFQSEMLKRFCEEESALWS